MKNEVVGNLRRAKKQINSVIDDVISEKDWKSIHKNIIQAVNLIKLSTRKFIIFNMLKKRPTSEFMKLYRHVN